MRNKKVTVEVRRKRIANIERNIKTNERIAATRKDIELIQSCKDNIKNLKMELEIEKKELDKTILRGEGNA